MSFKTLEDLNNLEKYQKYVKDALADADGKISVLQLYDNFPFTNPKKTGPVVLIGSVDGGLVKNITNAGAKLKGKGSITEADGKIKFKASGITVDLLTKAFKHVKVDKEVVAATDLAEATDGTDKPKETPLSDEKALELAQKKFPKSDLQKMLKVATGDDKNRLEANKTDYEKQIAQKQGTEALNTVKFLEKFLGEVEGRLGEKATALLRVENQQSRVSGYKPALHPRNKQEVETRCKKIVLKLAEKEIQWNAVKEEFDGLEKRYDEWDDVAEDFKAGDAEFHRLKTQSKPLQALLTKPKQVALKNELKEFADRAGVVGKLKLPEFLLDKGAWAEAIRAYTRLNEWLQEKLVPKDDDSQQDPVIVRMKKFVHDNPGTWVLNAVEYKNGTSAGDIGNKAGDLATGSLSSNTTAHGSVLKVNYEGHAHLDGGSGGVAFVYVLKDDYTVTPIVVDTSSKRGGKNGNQYEWDSGGPWAYFPPNASY